MILEIWLESILQSERSPSADLCNWSVTSSPPPATRHHSSSIHIKKKVTKSQRRKQSKTKHCLFPLPTLTCVSVLSIQMWSRWPSTGWQGTSTLWMTWTTGSSCATKWGRFVSPCWTWSCTTLKASPWTPPWGQLWLLLFQLHVHVQTHVNTCKSSRYVVSLEEPAFKLGV